MGKLKSFVVTFDNNKDVYQAGEIVSGKLIADVTEGIKARGVRVRFHGFAWIHSGEHNDYEHAMHAEPLSFAVPETYFDETITVWGKELGDRDGENPTLPAGYYEFPFRHQLGTGLPSSFEGSRVGYVRYSVKGIIDRPWKLDLTTYYIITVLDKLDLNQEPRATMPSGNQNSKTLCCLCCASGPIELQAQTDRGGYCPGERIVVKGSVENNSNTRITKTTAKIVQMVTSTGFPPTDGSVPSDTPSSTVEGPGCSARLSENIELVLPIPALPPSGSRYCNVIHIKYVVLVTAHIAGVPRKLEVELPITIGSVPLKTLYGGHPNPAYAPATATPLLPPPTYVEAEAGVDIVDNIVNRDKYTPSQLYYAPKYMYYDWSQHPQQ
ncbi:hypothetical protein Bbelb_071920 [Branchiostoma belcheri]|nr:hypothetical protein Bbelb_071920 [Branchiostoma belcheri]